MMKTIIIYESSHHENTKKLVDAISKRHEITAVPVTQASHLDLRAYDVIGLASGIAFGSFYPQIQKFAQAQLPPDKNVFFLYTCGKDTGKYTTAMATIAKKRGCVVLGSYGSFGFDTYGPFKFIGGIAKGHPTPGEIDGAVAFYERITQNT